MNQTVARPASARAPRPRADPRFVDYLYSKVIAAAERANPVVPAFIGVVGDEPGSAPSSWGHRLAPDLVGAVAVSPRMGAPSTTSFIFKRVNFILPVPPTPQGTVEKSVSTSFFSAVELAGMSAHQPHAAIDVVPHAAGLITPPSCGSVAATPPMQKP